MTIYLVISLSKISYAHRIYMVLVLANPNDVYMASLAEIFLSRYTVIYRVGQNRIFIPYMTVCMVISLLKIPYVHRIYV